MVEKCAPGLKYNPQSSALEPYSRPQDSNCFVPIWTSPLVNEYMSCDMQEPVPNKSSVLSRFIYFNQQKTSYLSFEKHSAKLVLFPVEISYFAYITSSETVSKQGASILKFSAPATITLGEVIKVRNGTILDQTEYAQLPNYTSNYNK